MPGYDPLRMDDAAASLGRNPIFAACSAEGRAALGAASRLLTVEPGEPVLRAGEPGERVFALLEGRVRVFHLSANGDEVVVKLFRAPAVFGEAEALSGLPYQEHVAAVDRSQILAMPRAALLRLLRAEHECAVRLLVDVARRLAIASYNEKSLAFHPATVRLASYLVDYVGWTCEPGAAELPLALTQDEMAAAIGVTRRSVAKDIAAWQQEGVLERRGGRYHVRDLAALQRYSDEQRLALAYDLDDLLSRIG